MAEINQFPPSWNEWVIDYSSIILIPQLIRYLLFCETRTRPEPDQNQPRARSELDQNAQNGSEAVFLWLTDTWLWINRNLHYGAFCGLLLHSVMHCVLIPPCHLLVGIVNILSPPCHSLIGIVNNVRHHCHLLVGNPNFPDHPNSLWLP